MNRSDLRADAKRLEKKVKDKTADFHAGNVSAGEFAAFMDKAHKQGKKVESALNALDRAKKFYAGNTKAATAATETRGADDERPMTTKQYAKAYGELKTVASRRLPGQSFAFDFALKSNEYRSLHLKAGEGVNTQGITGLQGENASGTTAGVELSNGTYFLPGVAGPDITPQFIPGILELRWYQNVIAMLFPTFPTDSPVVSYVRETAWNNASAATGEGETFPTSTNTIERYTEQVGKVANIIRMTDEMIQDDTYFQALIQKRCTMGVAREEEVQLLAGNGYPGVNGLLNRSSGFTAPQTVTALTNVSIPSASTAGVGAQTGTVSSLTPGRAVVGSGGNAPDGAAIAIGILAALTDIRTLHFFEPTHVVMNPADWFTVRTWQDNNGQFFAGSPLGRDYGYVQNDINPAVQAVDTALSLWGKSVVTTPAMPEGLILVGDFPDAGQVIRRGGLRVEITNTNGTDFEQGLWTMRAYSRVGLVIERPELFELIQLQA